MDSPAGHATVGAGESSIVEGGPHVQAAPLGRRNLVLILALKGVPFVTPASGGWTPSAFCEG